MPSITLEFATDAGHTLAYCTPDGRLPGNWAITGDTDYGEAVRIADGKYVTSISGSNNRLNFTLIDGGNIPAAAIIDSVVVHVSHRNREGNNDIGCRGGLERPCGSFYNIQYDQNQVSYYSTLISTTYVEFTKTLTTDPSTGAAWTKTNLYAANFITDRIGLVGIDSYDVDKFWLVVNYTLNWWKLSAPDFTAYQVGAQPSPFILPYNAFDNGIFYPKGSTFIWVLDSDPGDKGWWFSLDEEFNGAAPIVVNSRPKNPRNFQEIAAFAMGSAAWLGGFPGPACVWNNHLVYAEGGYSVGIDSPIIRINDGRFDREVVRFPIEVGPYVPIAVMTMLAANGTIYLTTLDTGSSSADWSGRVFSLDINSATLTVLGAALTTGHVPYALAWHLGRLWCGTHRQSSAAAGKIFYFRPGIDTSWTDDYTLSSSSTMGCSSLLSYKGLLYVGTTNAAAAFAQVLVRSELGAYTTTLIGTGGAATANNGFLALAEFQSNMYASFWNADTPSISKIYKFDNASWSTVYTASAGTLVPYLGFPTDNDTLLAIGGGTGYNAALISTTNGTSWSDRTAFLTQSGTAATGNPVFGVVVI